jgi:predicted homoserine dehydrogenase-like protein
LGLAHNVRVTRPIAQGQSLTWGDVVIDESLPALQIRREMETLFAPQAAGAQRAA